MKHQSINFLLIGLAALSLFSICYDAHEEDFNPHFMLDGRFVGK